MPASLRFDGVRVHPGMPFGFPPEYAFSFPGIPTHATPICNIDQSISITHVAFVTDAAGFGTAQTELKKMGISFDPPEDTGIAYSIFVLDPDGHQIEITTYDR